MTITHGIDARELTKHFGDVVAVDGISFQVEEGCVFALLGRNGSGKTTTVRMLTTLTRPTSGAATVSGIDVARIRDVRARIGVTFQDAALDPAMTGRDHLEFIGGLSGLGRSKAAARASELLDRFGLADHADRAIATLSGGTRRRLDVATAMINGPRVLFLDEPTTGLDPESRRAFWAEVRSLASAGTTVLLTTQYIEEADALADRLAIIDRGRVIAEGAPSALRATHGRSQISFNYSGDAQCIQNAIGSGVAQVEFDRDRSRATVSLAGAQERASVFDVLDSLRAAEFGIDRLAIAESSLEDVYLQLTGAAIDASVDIPSAVDPA